MAILNLSRVRPSIAKEWHPTKNGKLRLKDLAISSTQENWWRHKYKETLQWHEWEASVSQRLRGVKKCPYCANKKLLVGFNDLKSQYPLIAKEWNHLKNINLRSRDVIINSKQIVWWRHKHKQTGKWHEWTASIDNRVRRNNTCPYCGMRKVLIGFNDLKSQYPLIARQAYGWNPKSVTIGSSLKLPWKCKKGHKWENTVTDRVSKQGCPYCSHRRAIVGVNDLKTTHLGLARQANGWDATSITAGSGKRMSWKCKLGHVWFATVRDRVSGQNCATCSNRHLLVGFNDLLTKYPKIAKELLYTNPKTLLPGSRKKLTWKCKLGHTWKNTVAKRTRDGQNCPYCVGFSVWPGFNDIATTHSYLIKEIVQGNPTKVSAGSEKQFIWKCEKNHKWRTAVYHRTRGSGCPKCAKYGFDSAKPAQLYVISATIRKNQVIQFGISNDIQTRLATHARAGFTNTPVKLIPFRKGSSARALEVLLITLLKDYHIPTATQSGLKFDGSTEAFLMDDAMKNEDFLEEFIELAGLKSR